MQLALRPDLQVQRMLDDVDASILRALDVLATTQDADGSWRGDYGGPLFLLPMYVACHEVTGTPIPMHLRAGMERYFRATQHRDGGWGLHDEGHSHVFTTAIGYVAMRLLDVPADDPGLVRARAWLHRHGGPTRSAPWGRFVLCLLGLHAWEGIDPLPPELWLLPRAAPLHPTRFWCHCRAVYLPMSYLYARRVQAPPSARLDAIRTELYGDTWDRIPWSDRRHDIAPTDVYKPLQWPARAAGHALSRLEPRWPRSLRRRALDEVLLHIDAEDRSTSYLCIGPINKLLHWVVWHDARPGGEEVQRHAERLEDYLWESEQGVQMQGYNSSQLWDTAFAIQAITAAGEPGRRHPMVARAHAFVDANQVLDDVPDRERTARDPSRGGWPFSTRDHGWPITDCTAEGIKASLAAAPWVPTPLPDARLEDAIALILHWQNDDGGWATYERQRAPRWIEAFNPAACFGEIMVDVSYVECTSACMQALAAWGVARYDTPPPEHTQALLRGAAYLRREQRDDGSWEGSWAACFTYGTWFGVLGLLAAGASCGDPAIARATRFLAAHQRPDGSWGESLDSARERRWVPSDEGRAVQTSWALLALIEAGLAHTSTVQRGIAWLLARQERDGSWPEEGSLGLFNRTSGIHYPNYRKVFPLWALARFRQEAAALA